MTDGIDEMVAMGVDVLVDTLCGGGMERGDLAELEAVAGLLAKVPAHRLLQIIRDAVNGAESCTVRSEGEPLRRMVTDLDQTIANMGRGS